MATAKEGGIFRGRKTRDLVAECLGIAHGTVTTVMKEYSANKETSFEVICSFLAAIET
jgi:predicted transcriptional regulator YheO